MKKFKYLLVGFLIIIYSNSGSNPFVLSTACKKSLIEQTFPQPSKIKVFFAILNKQFTPKLNFTTFYLKIISNVQIKNSNKAFSGIFSNLKN